MIAHGHARLLVILILVAGMLSDSVRADDDNNRLAEYSFKESGPADEALIFTAPGFDSVGVPMVAEGADKGKLEIVIRDAQTGRPTCCRVNVVGPDGNFYEPKEGHLKIHSLTGVWPNWPKGWGNRPGKAPIRYFGRFFYCTGEAAVEVPAGQVRVEVWKGFEYRPQTFTTKVSPGETRHVDLTLTQTVSMPQHGYYSGDPHIHIPRITEDDDRLILDLLEAEDVHFGTILAYNEPAGPYQGMMNEMDAPQRRGLGKRSIVSRGEYTIVSGQEYRSSTYGHLNLFMLDDLVLDGQSVDANNWPLYGHIARAARELGGWSFYAHGGYAQEIYADIVQGNVDGVELLQFGVYRGIGLLDWYRMLNCGFRVPATAASDYPACRKLSDCRTYVYDARKPDMAAWLRGAADGKSFISTGPLLFLQVDGRRPGAEIDKSGKGPHRVTARVRVYSEVAPVTNVQLVAGGRIVEELRVPGSQGIANWVEIERELAIDNSTWIAARAFSLSRLGTPDAEAHTNPVYVYVDGRAPYDRDSLDVLLSKIDGQMAVHRERKFAHQASVLDYFERSRGILLKLREAGGIAAHAHPSELVVDTAEFDAGKRTHTEEELAAFLKPVPPKPIAEVLESFETVGGFRMELVAREPLVYDPIAAAFDEQGNLYVAEMRDYPYKPQPGDEPIGSIRMLKDTDGDGIFDEAHVFADKLLWAGGVAPWKGGVFVAAPPDIWYFKDTDGDNRADVRRKVFTGFGTQNQQAMLNNLVYGLDHKIYGSTAGNGGMVRPGDDPAAEPVSLDGRDFRFDPATQTIESITGSVQFGNSFDDWGNRFLCSQGEPLLHAVLPQRYLARNPFLPVPRAIQNTVPGPVPIFRISPIERWRQIRSSRRIAHDARSATSTGASHHVIDAGAGVTVYRGGAYPHEYYGSVFVGGAQNNVVHRRALVPDGVTFKSERADENTEFVRSSDNWFRPVNFVNAPDGTLYVLDMSREILEAIHIPLDVVKHLDLTSGRNYGRIYRIAPPSFTYPGPPNLAHASIDELVAALESPHGWWRDTAHRLIYERQDPAAVEPLRRLLRESSLPQARLHALWSLHGLNALADDELARGLEDESNNVREHAIRLAEARLDESPQLLEKVLQFADDPDPRIRCQVAFSLGETSDSRAATALAEIARSSASDTWIRTAVLSSATGFADRLLAELLSDSQFAESTAGADLLEQLARIVGARNGDAEISHLLETLQSGDASNGKSALKRRLVAALGEGLGRTGGRLDPNRFDSAETVRYLTDLFTEASKTAANEAHSEEERKDAIALLSRAPFDRSRDTLTGLIDVQQGEPIQIAAIDALATYPNSAVAAILLEHWQQNSPAAQKAALDALLSRDAWTLEFFKAVEDDQASAALIEPSRRSVLLKHANDTIRSLAHRFLSDATTNPRGDVIADYRDALELAGDAALGEAVFRRECMACHRIGDVGHDTGPDLASSANHDPASLLVDVIDPNRQVLPTYVQYVVVDTSGRTYTGLIGSQTATSITLKHEEGKTETILRTNVDQMVSTGTSLMPDGFEKKISKQEMTNLLAFLIASRPGDAGDDAPLDIGTLPGLIEPKD